MSDPDIQRLKNRFQDKLRTSRFLPETKARTGRLQSTTVIAADPRVYDVNGALVTNKLWVRLGATKANPAGRGQVAVWNFDKVATDKADLAVILVEGADGDLYIDRADTAAADTSGVPAGFYGDSGARPEELSHVLVPLANITDLQPIVDPVNGGLYIYIKPGWLPNGLWWPGGRYDMTSDVTATASMKAYIVGGIDLTASAIVADTGVDRSLAFTSMPVGDIETVLATFENVYPVFAVALANGATSFTNSDIVDIRTLGNGSGTTSTAGGDNVVYDDDGNVVYDDDGEVVFDDSEGAVIPYRTGLSAAFSADGDLKFIAERPAAYSTAFEAGTGTLSYAIADAATPTSFSSATLPFSLGTGDVLRITVAGLSGDKTVTLKRVM